MSYKLTPAERLIVAADFKPPPMNQKLFGYDMHSGNLPPYRYWVMNKVLELADSLKDTGVYIKINSALRACGYDLIDMIRKRGLRVFADLKLTDISETLSTDGIYLREARPDLVTVMCSAGLRAMQALKAELPDTEVLGVTVLTSLSDADTQEMFTCSTEQAVMRFAQFARDAGIDGLISSPKEVEILQAKFGLALSLNTPAIRPKWAIVPGDDQNPDRVMTPAKAIKCGADRIIVGRPIVNSENPRFAVMQTIEEIASVTM